MKKRRGLKKNNVVLRERKLANGNISLFLDTYKDGAHTYEFLKLYLVKARTPLERQANKEQGSWLNKSGRSGRGNLTTHDTD